MTRLNLLPPEVLLRRRARRLTRAAIAGILVVLVALGGLYAYQRSQLASVNEQLAQQQARNAALQAKIAPLAQFAQIEQQLASGQKTLAEIQADQIQWSGALRDLSMVIPDSVYVTAMSGSVTITGAAVTPGPTGLIGQLQFSGQAVSYPAVALWLNRLEEVTGWANAWVSTASQNTGAGGVQFAGTVDLTPQASQEAQS